MKRTSKSVAIWRCGVVIFALMAVVQLAIEIYHAPRVLQIGLLSETLVRDRFLRERGPTTFIVESVPPGSPLHDAGVVPGDRLRWDDPIGRWFNVAAGERIALTVLHGTESRRIEVTMPAASRLPRHQVATYVLETIERLVALFIGVIIGWRRPDLVAYRGLAAAGLLRAMAFPFSAPVAAHLSWLDFVASISSELIPGALVFFALNYPDDKPTGWRAVVKRYYTWIFGLQVALTVSYHARLYTGFFEAGLAWFFRVWPIAFPALFLWAIVLAWKQARGESRVRIQWILATLGTIMCVLFAGALNSMMGNPIPPEDMGLVLDTAALAAEVGLVYAILRRRIFDFGLAVNRTLVFAIVGAILLGVFQIAHGIVSQFLHFDDKNKTILLSAVLAVAVYLSFNQLKKVVEKFVDRLFFNSWAVNETDLKRFVAEAKHANDAQALAKLLVAAIDRFTNGTGNALYRAAEGGSFVRGESTLAAAPADISANDEAVLAMRAHGKAFRLRESSAKPARIVLRPARIVAHICVRELALPMAHRGELIGFLLLGPRAEAEPYRPDQVEALESAAHEVGLDFYALKLEQLTDQVAQERRIADTLRAQLQTAMALARPGTNRRCGVKRPGESTVGEAAGRVNFRRSRLRAGMPPDPACPGSRRRAAGTRCATTQSAAAFLTTIFAIGPR